MSAAEEDLKQYRTDLATIIELLNEGKIQPEIGEVMPLDYQVQGKIVLVSD